MDKPAYMKSEGKMISQCPQCLIVKIKYADDKYGPRYQNSIAKFGRLKKEICPDCKDKNTQ